MSCEFIGTSVCPLSEAIPTLRATLGNATEGFTAKELRDSVCNTNNDEARMKDCSTFNARKMSHSTR